MLQRNQMVKPKQGKARECEKNDQIRAALKRDMLKKLNNTNPPVLNA